MFCHVASEQVFGVHDVSSVYHVPLLLQSQGIVEFLDKRLKLGVSANHGVVVNGAVPRSLTITDEMRNKGRELGGRWKDLTAGYVLFYVFSHTYKLMQYLQPGTSL